MKIKAYIENPATPGAYITSRKQAEKYVARGRAKWIAPPRGFDLAIRFVERDGRDVLQAHLAKRDAERIYDRAAHRGLATHEQLRNLPFAGLTHQKYLALISK